MLIVLFKATVILFKPVLHNKLMEILHAVLEEIQPDGTVKTAVTRFIKRLEKAIGGSDASAEVVLGGSIAKDTYLKHDHDCDLFVRFSGMDDGALSDSLARIIEAADVSAERIHGSRDYFACDVDGMHYEIVPVQSISHCSEASNVTDCSVLHVAWVQQNTQRTVQGIRLNDHIRIAKAFCKAQQVYGAESYIGGFSGHVLDILIIHFGGFPALVDAATSWKSRMILDPESHYGSSEEARNSLNTAKISGPLILVDPIDPERNAAAALETGPFHTFIEACRRFKSGPSLDFFTRIPLNKSTWKYPQSEVIELHFTPLDRKRDIAGAKMKKAFLAIRSALRRSGFPVADAAFAWDTEKAVGLYHIPQQKISDTYIQQGPPTDRKDDCKAFRECHPDAHEQDGRLVVERQRDYTDVCDCMQAIIQRPTIVDRVAGISGDCVPEDPRNAP